MQIFGLKEELVQKQEEIRGLYLKNKELEAKIGELVAEVTSLKDKNKKFYKLQRTTRRDGRIILAA